MITIKLTKRQFGTLHDLLAEKAESLAHSLEFEEGHDGKRIGELKAEIALFSSMERAVMDEDEEDA